MVIRFIRLTQRITGAVLGSLAVSLLVGNVLVCFVMVLWGPTPIESSLGYYQ
jgi:hypothetical protein